MMDKVVEIAGRKIANNTEPFIIAELSGNHGQDLDKAKLMIKRAAAAGVHAVKLQTYTADTITLNSSNDEFQIRDKSSLWKGENLYSLYKKAHTPWEWHKELFELANNLGLVAFSSPFDESSVELLESLDVPCYKVASFELNHFPMLKRVAQTGKPVIMSTGMAQASEINESVSYMAENGCTQLVLLKCTSAYPAPVRDANLNTIVDMQNQFAMPIGLSDHSKGIGVSLVAASMGACVIERHFVLEHGGGEVDSEFSSTPEEFAQLVSLSTDIRFCRGDVYYGPTGSEIDSLKYRRSIYVCEDVRAGSEFSRDNIRVVRPGYGLHPKYFECVLGRRAKVDILKNSPLTEGDLV